MMGRLQAAVRDMAAKLDGVTTGDLAAFSHQGGAHPYLFVRGGIIHWIAEERGQVLHHRATSDLDEALHWVALDATRSMAMRWELWQRDRFPADRDSRIGWLAKQVELLRRLDAQWAEQFRAGIPAQCPGIRLEDVDAHPLTWLSGRGDPLAPRS
ncbi:Imm63 family immunity protein [Kitasatospora sp. NPDC057198]|uniref:Imm63 family immunity protein n=1 Tax=Kitasatospora sp. NPDC057198 TaxID=3346046 RepID=UPI00363443EC